MTWGLLLGSFKDRSTPAQTDPSEGISLGFREIPFVDPTMLILSKVSFQKSSVRFDVGLIVDDGAYIVFGIIQLEIWRIFIYLNTIVGNRFDKSGFNYFPL